MVITMAVGPEKMGVSSSGARGMESMSPRVLQLKTGQTLFHIGFELTENFCLKCAQTPRNAALQGSMIPGWQETLEAICFLRCEGVAALSWKRVNRTLCAILVCILLALKILWFPPVCTIFARCLC